MSKYNHLWEYIQNREESPLKLTFSEIRDILRTEIAHSFLKYKKELTEYRYEVKKISLKEQTIIFEKTVE